MMTIFPLGLLYRSDGVRYAEGAAQNMKEAAAAVAAKSLQSCLTLCDPRDASPPGSPVPGILQARTLEWVMKEAAAAAAKSLQSWPTLCNPIDSSPPAIHRPWNCPGKNIGVGCHFLLHNLC